MALFAGDKRKLENAELEEAKKRIFKGLNEADFADLAKYYATLNNRRTNADRIDRPGGQTSGPVFCL